jgi:coenzyme F420-reducing hydrogenase gamma subunit
MKNKLKIGVYGISGCAGCLLSILFEDCFKQLIKLVEIKAFPLIKENNYGGDFDYVFIEGTVCFDEDIIVLNELRKRAKYIVALGSCACTGGVPSIKNFLDEEKTMKLVYPVYNHLKSTPPTPMDMHIKVDYYLPQCPPNKEEIIEFIKCITTGREFKPYREPVCYECRRKGNLCLLTENKICLGPITNGGCDALCPTNSVTCYGCRGPCKDANIKAYLDMLKEMGYTNKNMHDKMNTFAGLQFKEQEGNKSKWLEK